MFLVRILVTASLCLLLTTCTNSVDSKKTPNVILVYIDDMGYGDLSSYGHPTIRTPNIDKLAANGLKFTQFYVASPVCTPSRSALLTGCYPKRVELHRHVIFPPDDYGINPEEETLAELFQEAGYKTACYGKWHLGNHLPFMPLQNGFDEYYGNLYSNDMCRPYQHSRGNINYQYDLPLIEGNDTLELNPDQSQFTRNMTNRTIEFIKQNSHEKFFIYLPHPMVHIPIHASEEFLNTSKRGLYGDVVEEIDWNMGRIMVTLEELGLKESTLILFTSDNGPWLPFKTHGGSAGPLRGGKGTTWEGGMREPCILYWPDGIDNPGRVDNRIWTNMDVLPTLAGICGLNLPSKKIDGLDLSSWLTDSNINEDNRPFYYYTANGHIQGIRIHQWKYRMESDTSFLFNLEEDISEQYNLIDAFPEKADSMKQMMLDFDSRLTQEARKHGIYQ